MLKLKFNLRHQDIQFVNKGVVVATDSKDYLVAKFNTISDDWETPLTAVFTDDKHNQPYAVVVGADERLAEDECFVPWEVLTDAANVYVSAYCGNLHTTVTAVFKVRKSGYIEGETPPPPSPTVYDIIMQAITDLQVGKQDKLTAGENITIDANGRISASGGVTSYTELSDKPRIRYRETYNPNVTHTVELTMPLCLTDSIRAGFVTNDSREELRLDVANTAAFWYDTNLNGVFDLNSIDVNGYQTGRKGDISNLPDFVNTSNASNLSLIQVLNFGFYNGYRLQFMSWIDSTTNTSKFAYRYVGGRLGASKNNWKELSPTITSAAVNQNGTITFTMSDGSTITSTGATLENAANKVTSINSSSTDTQYPSAKAVYDAIQGVSNYTLTEQDKQDIADIVLQRLQGGD